MSFGSIVKGVVDAYNASVSSVPPHYKTIIDLLLFTVLIVIYAVFIWKFYRFIAKKDIVELNLNQYNTTVHPFLSKIIAIAFFLLEYIIIVPFLVVFWFSVFACFLLFLSKTPTSQVLLITAAIISSIRIVTYYKRDLAKDLAKMFPFTILVIFLITPDFFVFQKLVEQFKEIPALFNQILYYLIFIFVLEIFLRFLDSLLSLMHITHEPETKQQQGQIQTQ